MAEEPDLLRNVTPEQEEAVLEIADRHAKRLSIDWKIAIPSIVAAVVVITGYVWVLAGKSDALEEVQRITAGHTQQISELNKTVVDTKIEIVGVEGDIKEILAILRQNRDSERSPR